MLNEDDTLAALTDQPVSVVLGKKTFQLRRVSFGDFSATTQFKKRMSAQEDTLEYDLDSLSLAFLFCRLMIPTNSMKPEDFLNSVSLEDTQKITKILNEMGLKAPSQK